MNKLLAVTPFLLLAPFVAGPWQHKTAPAQDTRAAEPQGLVVRVAALEGELAAEKKRGDETRALLDQTFAYLEQQAKGAQTLLGVLQESEQQGFAVGENWRSRETLLAGLRAYWSAASTGLPKVPAPASAPEKTAPVRTRPVRQ